MRVIVGEDSALFREGLAALLQSAGHTVIGRAATAADTVAQVRALTPDVVVLDVRLPADDEGIGAAIDIRRSSSPTPVLLLYQHIETRRTMELVRAGAIGYLLKDRVLDVDEFLAALTRVAAGGTALDPEVVSRLLGAALRASILDELTPRELDVLHSMAEGRSNSAIAQRLFLSERTVETHIGNIFVKLDLPATPNEHRRVRAILTYLDATA